MARITVLLLNLPPSKNLDKRGSIRNAPKLCSSFSSSYIYSRGPPIGSGAFRDMGGGGVEAKRRLTTRVVIIYFLACFEIFILKTPKEQQKTIKTLIMTFAKPFFKAFRTGSLRL